MSTVFIIIKLTFFTYIDTVMKPTLPKDSSPIKASITGWNPLLMVSTDRSLSTVESLNGALRVGVIPGGTNEPTSLAYENEKLKGSILLSELNDSEKYSNNPALQQAATALGWTEENLTALVGGIIGKSLANSFPFNHEISSHLLTKLPGNSETRHQLQALVPALSDKRYKMHSKPTKELARILSDAPEFQGLAGKKLLHSATMEAVRALIEKGITEIKTLPAGSLKSPEEIYRRALMRFDFQLVDNLGHKGYPRTMWYDNQIYLDNFSIREQDFSFTINNHVPQLTINPAKVLLRSIERKAAESNEFRSYSKIKGLSNEEAKKILHTQRDRIIDIDARNIVDFTLGQNDVRIMYVGSDHIDKKRAGGDIGEKENGFYRIIVNAGDSPYALVHECAHLAIALTYRNYCRPYANEEDRKLFLQALRADTKEGITASGLREKLGIAKEIYNYEHFAPEIPAYIIQHKATGDWTTELAADFPHLTAYVEKIVIPDINLHIAGHEAFVPRPATIEQLISPDWPPTEQQMIEKSWPERVKTAKTTNSSTMGHHH